MLCEVSAGGTGAHTRYLLVLKASVCIRYKPTQLYSFHLTNVLQILLLNVVYLNVLEEAVGEQRTNVFDFMNRNNL